MSLGSIYTTRTTSSLMSQQLVANLANQQTALAKLQQQISTGKQLLSASDNPLAASQILALNTAIYQQATFQNNIDTNQGFLSVTDQALSTVNDAVNQAKSIASAGLNTPDSSISRIDYANQIDALIQTIVNAGNTQYNGRYLFGGSYGTTPPFTDLNGVVRYNGDSQSLQTFANTDSLVANNVDGQTAFAGLTSPIQTRDLNPAVSLSTQLSALQGGNGIPTGSIDVTVVNGATTITQTVDLTNASTLQDVKTRIENAFSASSITVSVATTQNGLQLTPSAGTIAIQNHSGSNTATDLGIVSTATANIIGSDLNPKLSLFTPLSALNSGTGIGSTSGTGLKIVNGSRTSIVDLNGAVTVQDLLNRIQAADPDVIAEISADGTGISVSSRLSGADFSIGENGGQNATLLGIRTLNSSTLLSDLNHGTGIAFDQGTTLTIQRRDGSTATVDLTGVATVQDVLDKINAVDPGHLTASLNSVGNGISLTDDSGSGTLTVADSELSRQLGIAGSDSNGSSGVLVGTDVNPQQPSGILAVLSQLSHALRTDDTQTMNRLLPQLDAAASQISAVRGALGARQQLLDSIKNQLGQTEISTKSALSQYADADIPALITQLVQQQQSMQYTLQIAAQVNQLSLLNYL